MKSHGRLLAIGVGLVWALCVVGCAIGGLVEHASFLRAWLCSYLFWLGVPLGGVTLILVHDLSGGRWMAAARPALMSAAATMPLATLAGIPAFVGIGALYPWTHPSHQLPNSFYLNPFDFQIRYAIDVVLWNLLAAYALFGPRFAGRPIAPGLSWISGLGLVALALSAAFAAIDWVLSLEPTFWSSIFPYIQSASWFNTGMSAVVMTVAVSTSRGAEPREHMADLARILFATTIFWAYVEFIQFLIIWEENLKDEIPWYLKRLHSPWQAAAYVVSVLGFFVPFFTWLWAPTKRHRGVVITICVSILISRLADAWLLVLPESNAPTPFWLDAAAVLTLGGAMAALFRLGWRYAASHSGARAPFVTAEHG